MKPLFRLLIAFVLAAAAMAARAEEKNPALYSFADISRLAVSAALAAPAPAAETPEPRIRLATDAAAAEPRFSVAPMREPGRWMLLFAGLAAAGWVAHRRLAHSF